MRRLKVTIAYDGTNYCGWQLQPTGRSLQGTFEDAWQRVTQEATRAIASGRTDAGVHALGQVISLSTSSTLTNSTLVRALNASLPDDIRVHAVCDAPLQFHAIRDAQGKRYRYLIQDGEVADVFCRRYAWHLSRPVNWKRMQTAARILVGRHDFRAFQSSGSPRLSTVRHVRELDVHREKTEREQLIRVEIEADGFLYNMVRNIVGTLVEVGRGKHEPEWVEQVLLGRRRELAGPTAPAHGLCLVSVSYESHAETSAHCESAREGGPDGD